MTPALGVDASLAMKWVVPEFHSDRAQQFWADSLASARRVVAPPHFAGEVANDIYQRVRTIDPAQRLDLAEAEASLAQFLRMRWKCSPRKAYTSAPWSSRINTD